MKKVSCCNSFRELGFGNPAREYNRHAICMDNIRILHCLCELSAPAGKGNALSIGREHSLWNPRIALLSGRKAILNHEISQLGS